MIMLSTQLLTFLGVLLPVLAAIAVGIMNLRAARGLGAKNHEALQQITVSVDGRLTDMTVSARGLEKILRLEATVATLVAGYASPAVTAAAQAAPPLADAIAAAMAPPHPHRLRSARARTPNIVLSSSYSSSFTLRR